MALGSRLTIPTWPAAAEVVSEPRDDALKTPWFQSKLSHTRGTVSDRLPPKRIAEIGTPLGLSNSFERIGQLYADTVKRELGCAATFPDAESQGLPCQSRRWAGALSVNRSEERRVGKECRSRWSPY